MSAKPPTPQGISTADDREHVMTYAAGGALAGVHLRGPGWSCRCGGWAFRAKAMPRRKTGNNQIEALKSYRAHVDSSLLAAKED